MFSGPRPMLGIPRPVLFLALLPPTGCVLLDEDALTDESGIYDLTGYFQTDGEVRESTYANEDPAVTGSRRVRKTATDVSSGVEVVTFEHADLETGLVLFQVQWSNADREVLIHGWTTAGGEEVRFSSPVVVGQGRLWLGDSFVTTSDGFSFTSTLEAVEGCATSWAPSWEDEGCLRVSIDDGDGDPDTNGAFTGTYWVVPGYGVALMELDSSSGRWNLTNFRWEEG